MTQRRKKPPMASKLLHVEVRGGAVLPTGPKVGPCNFKRGGRIKMRARRTKQQDGIHGWITLKGLKIGRISKKLFPFVSSTAQDLYHYLFSANLSQEVILFIAKYEEKVKITTGAVFPTGRYFPGI
jgi:hypothetical protein